MADFDNGLPPEGTDITGNNISSTVIDSNRAIAGAGESISAILADTAQASQGSDQDISRVVTEKEETGFNFSLFL